MRPLFSKKHIYQLEECLYEARKELRRYWAGTLICLPSTHLEDILNTTLTEYDVECQRILLNSLSNIDAHITIYSEDSTSEIVLGNHGDFSLLIDPLDGTHNAMLGFPSYTSSVALYHGSSYIFGWVYDISRDVVFTAALGEGAYLQSPIIVKRLKTRKVSHIDDMRISFHRPNTDSQKKIIDNLLWSANKVRIYSCSSLEICLIAAGILDAFIDVSTPGHERSCDIAAAELILKEAGGAMFDGTGKVRYSLPPSEESLTDRGTLIALSSAQLIKLII
ncbi:inositol monophosphatase family protein [Pseudomonas sp. Z1-14]|uniref:inositol monophosphatase family protein n=1 Tax=Pseudomonas sp. Z1-14 TaxID=2817409 RepID=UPI003DA9D9C6